MTSRKQARKNGCTRQRGAIPAVLTVLALAFAPHTVALMAQDGAGPKAVVARPSHDFGTVTVGTELSREFVIENRGDAPLLIREINSNCACTITEHDATVAPGQRGKIAVTLDTTLLIGPEVRTLTVLTNDASNPAIELGLTVEVRPIIAVSPGYVRYVVVQGFDQPGLARQYLYSMDASEMTITAARSHVPSVSVTFREATQEERRPDVDEAQWIVDTVLSQDARIGPIVGFVEIEIDHPKQSLVSLPLSGFVRPIFAITPNDADFGQVQTGGKVVQASLHIKNFADELIQITDVEESIDGVVAAVEPIEDGRTYWLYVNLEPDIAKGPFRGTITLRTSSPKKPVIQVTVQGTAI